MQGDYGVHSENLFLFGVGGFLAARFAQFKFELLALVEQGSALIANRLQGQAFAKGFTDANGIGGFAIHLKNSKTIQCAIGIFTRCNHPPQKDGVGS